MARQDIGIDVDSHNKIAACAAIMGAITGFMIASNEGASPGIGLFFGAILCGALSLYSRGLGITILVLSALILLGQCSGN